MYYSDIPLRIIYIIISIFLLTFVIIPGILVFSTSFQGNDGSVSFQWYLEAFTTTSSLTAIWNTAIIVVLCPLIGVILGTFLAWIINRTDMPFRRFSRVIPFLPILLPSIVSAVGWVFLLSPRQGYLNVGIRKFANLLGFSVGDVGPFNVNSFGVLLFVISMIIVPFTYIYVSNAFNNMNSSLEEAAQISGASQWKTLFNISIPLVTPALLSSLLFALVISVSEFAASSVIGIPANIQVLPTLIHQSMTIYPQKIGLATALGTILVIIVTLGVYFQNRITKNTSYITISGKGFQTNLIKLGILKWLALAAVVIYAFITIVLPVGSIFIVSLLPYWSPEVGLNQATFTHYQAILDNKMAVNSIVNTVLLAIVGTTVANLLAFIMAIILVRTKRRGNKFFELLGMAALGIPGIVFSIGALTLFTQSPIRMYGTHFPLIIIYSVIFLPLVLRSMVTAMMQVHPELEEASFLSGAGMWKTIVKILLPIVAPSLATSWVLGFVLITHELPAATLLTVPGMQVMSTYLLGIWGDGAISVSAAFAMVMFLISAVAVIIGQAVASRFSNKSF